MLAYIILILETYKKEYTYNQKPIWLYVYSWLYAADMRRVYKGFQNVIAT